MTGRMLIAGVGNIFLGDDGFGPEVARRLATTDLPGWVRVADYGISGMHLAYDLADGYDCAVLIDAAPRGDKPGTVTLFAPTPPPRPTLAPTPTPTPCPMPDVAQERRRDAGPAAGTLGASRLFDAHGMQPDVVLGVLDMLGAARPARILVVGCEPASTDYGMQLSEPVAAAVDEAVRVVLDLVAEAHGQDPETTGEGVSHVPGHSR